MSAISAPGGSPAAHNASERKKQPNVHFLSIPYLWSAGSAGPAADWSVDLEVDSVLYDIHPISKLKTRVIAPTVYDWTANCIAVDYVFTEGPTSRPFADDWMPVVYSEVLRSPALRWSYSATDQVVPQW
ncbi:hypothetical protein AURDEDRAFT_165508 [Auricularia subglabra TFB-10046 SS5]|nr:hypothetical protein AURDEDRAFT_165508 [Auricularia subglabra TFB-10046 SS5]